jgi:hypothetical protein
MENYSTNFKTDLNKKPKLHVINVIKKELMEVQIILSLLVVSDTLNN